VIRDLAIVAIVAGFVLAIALAIQARTPRSFVACDEPREGETLLITVVRREGKIAATCAAVTGSSSAARKARGAVQAAK
jgi:hypothetical protein